MECVIGTRATVNQNPRNTSVCPPSLALASQMMWMKKHNCRWSGRTLRELPSLLAAATDQHGTLGPAYNNINTIIANKTIYCNIIPGNIKVQLTSCQIIWYQYYLITKPKLMNLLNSHLNSNVRYNKYTNIHSDNLLSIKCIKVKHY